MKKIFASIIALSLVSVCAYAAQITKFSNKFIKKFRDCDYYTETVSSEFEGETFTTTRKIIGWKNGMCKYQSVMESKNGTYQLDCSFSEMQVDDLYEAMKDKSNKTELYNLEIFAPVEDPKTGEIKYTKKGSTAIRGNKAYITWAKFENNPYFCKPTKLK